MPPKSRASVVPVEPETGRPLSVEGTLLLVETACVGDGVPLVVAMLGVGEIIDPEPLAIVGVGVVP